MRLLCTIAAVLLTAGMVAADYQTGYQEDGYTYAGAGYWNDSYGTSYTREYVEYPGYRTSYSYGYAYKTPVTYYYYRYARASKPVPTAKSTEAERIAFLKQRERIAGEIAKDAQATEDHLRWLDKVGVTPPFPGVSGYSHASGGSYSALSGQTLYGHGTASYTFQQQADFYGAYDPAITQQAWRGSIERTFDLSKQVTTDVGAQAERDASRAERLQAIRADNDFRLKALELSRPPNRVTTTIQRTAPAVMPRAGEEHLNNAAGEQPSVASTACVSCHSGKEPAGKLDMTVAPTEDQVQKMMDRMSRPASDPKHMPASADGKPGRTLSVAERLNVLNEASKAAAPKP